MFHFYTICKGQKTRFSPMFHFYTSENVRKRVLAQCSISIPLETSENPFWPNVNFYTLENVTKLILAQFLISIPFENVRKAILTQWSISIPLENAQKNLFQPSAAFLFSLETSVNPFQPIVPHQAIMGFPKLLGVYKWNIGVK